MARRFEFRLKVRGSAKTLLLVTALAEVGAQEWLHRCVI